MKRETLHTDAETPKAERQYITFPRIQGLTFTHILTGILIIASFLLGSLYTRVSMLEKGSGTKVEGTTTAAIPSGIVNQPLPTIPAKVTVDAGHLPVKGNKDAKVTIVEFADFRCPFCEQFFTNVEPQLMKDYVDTGKAKFVFRHYAFLGPASDVAANASECANDQGKFWDMYTYFYKNQPPETDISMYTVDNLTTVAGTLGMDTAQFNSCLAANKFASNVSADLAAGKAAGITATPTFVINGTLVVGAQPYSVFQTTIDAALKS